MSSCSWRRARPCGHQSMSHHMQTRTSDLGDNSGLSARRLQSITGTALFQGVVPVRGGSGRAHGSTLLWQSIRHRILDASVTQ